MNAKALEHRLSENERQQFQENGYIIIPDALSPEMLQRLNIAVDRFYEKMLQEGEAKPGASYEKGGFIGVDPLFQELLDWPTTFPKVWDLLSWNIYLYTSHLNISPPLPKESDEPRLPAPWHQDGARFVTDLGEPRPMCALKIAYYLSDVSEAGRGNTYIIPGSQNAENHPTIPDQFVFEWIDGLPKHSSKGVVPPGAIPLCGEAGTAIIIDQRVWHSKSPNYSDITRKVLFMGYGYRWLQPFDVLDLEHCQDCEDPIRRQLLDLNPTQYLMNQFPDRYFPTPDNLPLLKWLKEHVEKNRR